MRKAILYRENNCIPASSGLVYLDGRFNLCSIKNYIKDRNKRVEANFPHLICDGFRFCDDRLNEYGSIIKL